MTRSFGRFLRRNTIALLALFVALSGTTFAAGNALLPKNSVGTKQLRKNAVTGVKIKKNAVTGIKVKNNSLKGADILESSLAKVPSAANADHATSADSATNATNATNATSATNATQLGGVAAAGYQTKAMWAEINAAGDTVLAQSGGVSIQSHFAGGYYLHFPGVVQNKAIVATPISSAAGSPGGTVDLKAAPCGGSGGATAFASCSAGTNTSSDMFLATFVNGTQNNVGFFVAVIG